jgi:hypothetical protein
MDAAARSHAAAAMYGAAASRAMYGAAASRAALIAFFALP